MDINDLISKKIEELISTFFSNYLLKPIAKIKELYYYNYSTNPKKNKRKRHKKMIKAETVAAVERERERESHNFKE